MVVHLHDAGRPYIYHLKAGFGTGLGMTALLAGTWSSWPLAFGMWAQTIAVTARAYNGYQDANKDQDAKKIHSLEKKRSSDLDARAYA